MKSNEVIETDFINECFAPKPHIKDPVDMQLAYRVGVIFLLLTLILLTLHYIKRVNTVQLNIDELSRTELVSTQGNVRTN